MSMLDLVAPASAGLERTRLRLVVGAGLAGITSVIALQVVNESTEAPADRGLLDVLVFVASALISLFAARAVAHRMIENIEGSLHALKLRIVDKILAADLRRFEQIGGSEIFDRLGQNLAVFTIASAQVGGILQSVCVFACSLVYLAWLSPSAFLLLLPLQLLGVLAYRSRQRVVEALLETVEHTRLGFFDRLTDLLRGAKELKLGRARARAVQDHFEHSSAELRDLATRVSVIWDDNMLFMTVNLYLLLAAVAFVLPSYVELPAAVLAKVLVALMFSWGAVRGGLVGFTSLVEAQSALARVEELEAKLDPHDLALERLDPWPENPGRIEASALEYEYVAAPGEQPFRVGPLDLAIEPGEIVFIVGGNGSGKSTLLKLLTGLYAPEQGLLRVGGVAVQAQNVAAFRERISVIFSDFHLFARAYGLLDVDPDRVRELLVELHIDHKTSYARGRFNQRALSTGQRKRLAMVVALLEQRPIIVLDEWAADQDPEFRRYFYETLLPLFKQQGKTVIAVSHDDRFFHCADRVVVMDYGVIRPG